MEKKYNNIVITLLIIAIVILGVLCYLFATDKITFNLNDDKEVSTEIKDTNDDNKIYTKDEYVSLEDVQINDNITTKKVKLNHLSDQLTNDFYDQQSNVVESIKSNLSACGQENPSCDSHISNVQYNLEYYMNGNILSIIYYIEPITENGIEASTTKAVTNINVKEMKIVTEEELLNLVNKTYEKIVNEWYDEELNNWTKLNESNNEVISYYDVTYDDFKNNKSKYIELGTEKIGPLIYTYIKDNKVLCEYKSISKITLFHEIGKGGNFPWEQEEFGNYNS